MRHGPLAAGVVLIVIVAVFHGYMTHRWSSGDSVEMQRLVAQYGKIPHAVGDWVSPPKDNPMRPGELRSAGAAAHISRTYRNTRTGEVVGVFMICGEARNVAVHTPEACYVAQGFEMTKDPETISVPTGDAVASMIMSTFKKGSIHQQIYWAWNAGNGWESPGSPRAQYYAWMPLTKIYVIADVGDESKLKQDAKNPSLNFADVFLPAANGVLYPAAH